MLGGYMGTLLDVDLTSGIIHKLPLPEEAVLRTWVGGTGLALHLLCQYMRPDARAFDADTPVIIMTGPLTGTKAISSSDWKVVTVNPQLPYHPTVSQSHGYFGVRLKQAGYDGIIIRGKAEHPVYLWIDDDTVQLRDASHYWGMDIFESQHAILTALKDDGNISVACIGPAGENLLFGGSVRNDQAFGANRGSPGSVWGSKNLKAIATRGTKSVPIYDQANFMKICEQWLATLHEVKLPWLQVEASVKVMPALARRGMVPAKNWTDPEFQVAWGDQYETDMGKWKTTPLGSWECFHPCHHETIITTGPFAGTRVCGHSAEVIEGGATNLGIFDPGTCLAMAGFYDAMGIDISEVGRMLALAFEMYEKGLLTEEETGGLKLKWGDDEAVRELLMQMINREGLGAILVKESTEACRELGRGAEAMLQHIKGIGFNPHDQIGWGLGLLFQSIVSGAGPTWQGMGAEMIYDPDLGYPSPVDPSTPDGKAEACYKTQVKKMWEDSTGICIKATWGVPGITQMLPQALAYATGVEYSWDEAWLLGERIINVQRLYAMQRGFRKEYDMQISERIMGPRPGGPATGRNLGPHLVRMVKEYYGFMGWSLKSGAPLPETVRKVGLEGYNIGRPADAPEPAGLRRE